MNIRQQKTINGLLFIAMILLQLSCKSSRTSIEVISISKGIETSDQNYNFSENADIEIENSYYSLRSKAEYSNGKVVNLIIYHPEGELNYGVKELTDDPKLLPNYGYSFNCTVEREGDKLIDSNNAAPQDYTLVTDKILKTAKDQFIVLYEIK